MRWVILVLVAMIGLSPRIPLPVLVPGKRFDLRIEDIILLGAFLAVLVSAGRLRRAQLQRFKFVLPYFAIMLLTTGVGLASGTVTVPRSLPFVLKECEYFLIAFLIANWVVSERHLQVILRGILTVATLNAVWVFVQVASGRYRPLVSFMALDRPDHSRVLSSYGPGLIGEMSPFSTGGFFMLTLLLALSLLLFGGARQRTWPLMMLVPALAACLFLSDSRINIAAAVLGASYLIFLRNNRSMTRRVLGTRLVAVLVVAGSIGILGGMTKAGLLPMSIRWLPENIEGSYTLRSVEIWDPVLSMSLDRVVVGYGKGSLAFTPGLATTESHNHYLRVLVESGAFGLIAFVAILVHIVFRTWRTWRRARSATARSLSAAVLSSTLVLSLGAILGDVFLPVVPNELWWSLIGLAFAADEIERRQARSFAAPAVPTMSSGLLLKGGRPLPCRQA